MKVSGAKDVSVPVLVSWWLNHPLETYYAAYAHQTGIISPIFVAKHSKNHSSKNPPVMQPTAPWLPRFAPLAPPE